MARRCLVYLESTVQRALTDALGSLIKDYDRQYLNSTLIELIERQLIVRRFDIEDMSAAAVFHVIHRNVIEAQWLVSGPAFPPHRKYRARKAARIRLVIDDLRVLCSVSPSLIKETAFLPYLTFFLEREGLTSLLVYTDSVLPNKRPEDETSRALYSLLRRVIVTWNVPFEGQNRIAISVLPPAEAKNNGVVRELTLEERATGCGTQKAMVPVVTPKFELYSGIEENKPRPIPLAIYLFSETKQFEAYVDDEDALFRELFTSVEGSNPIHPGRVLYGLDAKRYLALRDYAHLFMDAQDGHTMVFQVDGHWAQGTDKAKGGLHALESQHDYMEVPFSENESEREAEDPFSVFRTGVLGGANSSSNGRKRAHYFKNSHYEMNGALPPDRIPFMWDFGFVLARSAPWEVARTSELKRSNHLKVTKQGTPGLAALLDRVLPQKGETVGAVYERLGKESNSSTVSWRKFFGACKVVAELHHHQTGAPAIAFDVSAPSTETLNALLLEIWFSEMKTEMELDPHWVAPPLSGTVRLQDLLRGKKPTKSIKKSFENLNTAFKTRPTTFAGRQLAFREVPLGAICLYKTWLLMLEVIDFESYLQPDNRFTFKPDHLASLNAVASRHWYKTACSYSEGLYGSEGIHDAPVPLRMAGRYSSRGDWFLGSPRSSRSRLLAQHAFDLLSSRRGNIARLQRGLGLPVRDIAEPDVCGETATALRCKLLDTKDPYLTEIKYGRLAALGAGISATGTAQNQFEWLLRSSIEDYDRLSRALHRWLSRLFLWTVEYKKRHGSRWHGGFRAYDELTFREFSEVSSYDSFIDFGEQCDLLASKLDAASR